MGHANVIPMPCLPELVAALAPTTSIVELTRLARHEDDEVVAAVASNPSAPSALLGMLCLRFAPQVLANVVLPWVLLDEPFFFARLDEPRALAVIRQQPLGDDVLGSLASHSSYMVRVQTVMHPSSSVALLRRLSTDVNPFVRRAVGSRQHCPTDVITALAAHEDPITRQGVAVNEACPPDVLATLATDANRNVREIATSRRRR